MRKIERFIVYGVVIVLFCVAIPFDLKITQGLFQPGNGFGKILEIIGEIPLFTVGVFGAILIALHHPKPSREVDWTLTLFFFIAAIAVAAYAGYHTQKLIARNFMPGMSTMYKVLFIGLIAVICFGVGLFCALLVDKKQDHQGFTLGVYLLATIGLSVLLMQGLKMVWLRPRYRTLDALYQSGQILEIADFWLPFYRPQFFTAFSSYGVGGKYGFTQEGINKAMGILGVTKWSKEEFYSFPSGHTMNTIVCLSLLGLPNAIPALREKKRFGEIFRYCMYGYAAVIAFSRILCGAHNATDVLAGYLFGLALFDLGYTFFYKGFLLKRFSAETPYIKAYER